MKPTIPEVLPLVRALYAREPCGCCLHVVLDDGNVDDSSVAFCVDYARERGHAECLAIAEKLAAMSRTQRKKLSKENPWRGAAGWVAGVGGGGVMAMDLLAAIEHAADMALRGTGRAHARRVAAADVALSFSGDTTAAERDVATRKAQMAAPVGVLVVYDAAPETQRGPTPAP